MRLRFRNTINNHSLAPNSPSTAATGAGRGGTADVPGMWDRTRGRGLPAVFTPAPVRQLCAAEGLLHHLREHRERDPASHHRLILTSLGRLKNGLEGAGLRFKHARRRRLHAASHAQTCRRCSPQAPKHTPSRHTGRQRCLLPPPPNTHLRVSMLVFNAKNSWCIQ